MNNYRYEVKDTNYLVYRVENCKVINYQVEIINNNPHIAILGLKEIQEEEGVKVEFNINNKTSIAEIIRKRVLRYNEILHIINSICGIYLKSGEYLLNTKNLLINNESIFIDNDTGEIYMCYLPINQIASDNQIGVLKKYIIDLCKHINRNIDNEEVDYLDKLEKYIIEPNINILNIKQYIENLQKLKKDKELIANITSNNSKAKNSGIINRIRSYLAKNKEKSIYKNKKAEVHIAKIHSIQNKSIQNKSLKNDSNKEENVKRAYIVYGDKTIYLNKDIFLIGRMKDAVDYSISSNAVGRVHVRIERENNSYYITDLFSKNGTYINGEKLLGNKRYKLENGYNLKLANINMIFNK